MLYCYSPPVRASLDCPIISSSEWQLLQRHQRQHFVCNLCVPLVIAIATAILALLLVTPELHTTSATVHQQSTNVTSLHSRRTAGAHHFHNSQCVAARRLVHHDAHRHSVLPGVESALRGQRPEHAKESPLWPLHLTCSSYPGPLGFLPKQSQRLPQAVSSSHVGVRQSKAHTSPTGPALEILRLQVVVLPLLARSDSTAAGSGITQQPPSLYTKS